VLSGGSLASIQERALWLGRINHCLQKHLPLSINTVVKLANIDTRQRAVIHVRGGEWATQVRLQQGMIKAILRSCGTTEIKGVVVKNRPLKNLAEEKIRPQRVNRNLSGPNRQLVETIANGVSDKRLQQSLRRLARKRV
jgi:hypothetical protein